STWVPFVIFGKHPRLAAGPRHSVASQLDVGPTLLDLAGIDRDNAFMGHSLVRARGHAASTSYQLRGDEAALDTGLLRVPGGTGAWLRGRAPPLPANSPSAPHCSIWRVSTATTPSWGIARCVPEAMPPARLTSCAGTRRHSRQPGCACMEVSVNASENWGTRF